MNEATLWICTKCGKDNPCRLTIPAGDPSEPEKCPFAAEKYPRWEEDVEAE